MIAILKRNRHRIIGIVVLLLLIILFFLPSIAKNYAINNSKELLGRQIAMEQLKYNYFTSTAQVYNFDMFEPNERDPFVSFDTLVLDLEPLRLLFGEMNVEQFYIDGLEVNVQMKDSTFNFDDLIAFHSTSEDSATSDTEENFKYDLSNLELKSADFFFDNQNVGKVTHIENFSFSIPKIVWDQAEKSSADLEFTFKNGGYFKSELDINPNDGEFDAHVEVNNLNLNAFYEYAAQYAEVNSFEGLVSSKIEINGNINNAITSILSGQVDVSNFEMTDTNDKAFLKSNQASVKLNRMDYANQSYDFGTIELSTPYLYFQMDSITNNLFQIFKLDDAQDPAVTSSDSESSDVLNYSINKLIVKDGLMDYSDNLTGQRFDYHMNAISVNSDPITSQSEWINIYADMLLNNRGTMKSKLGINPKSYDNLDLDLVVENFLLSDINIYAKHYTGHNILLGDFYYYSKSKVTNGDISSENQLLVKNVSIENTKGGLYKLPLKFALFLLKDKNGDVNLTVPVRGNMNDPEINIGKLVWTTIKNKITGAASDPISSLASLVDVDPKDYKEIVFALLL